MPKPISQKQQDLQLGEKGELSTIDKLSFFLEVPLTKTKSSCHIFDFENIEKKIYVELKTRRNDKMRYPTTMIGLNKFNRASELYGQGYTVYFVFKFTDSLCYFKFQGETPLNWVARGGRCDRGRPEYKQYVFIPVDELIDIP